MENDGRVAARKLAKRMMATARMNDADLARDAKVDPKTVRAFLNGERWPQRSQRAKMATVLGLEADGLDEDVAPVSPFLHDRPDEEQDELLYRRPPGMTDAEWDRVRESARDYIEWQIQQASKER